MPKKRSVHRYSISNTVGVTQTQTLSFYLWLPYVIGQATYIFILWFLLLLLFFPHLILAVGDWRYFHTWCGLSADLE